MKKLERLDHGYYTVPIWLGLFFSGLYVIGTPEDSSVAAKMPDWADNMLGLAILFGSGLCLWGAARGTRWCKPDADLRESYKAEIAGLIVICVVLGILATVTDLTLVQQFTLAGGLGALVQIASINMIVQLWLAVRAAPAPEPDTN